MKTGNPDCAPAAARARLEWALGRCAAAGLRLTPVRRRLLAALARRRTPMTLGMAAQLNGVRNRCAATTVYRTLMLFARMELVRQIRLPNKFSYFVLNAPDGRLDYLICRRCGAVTELPPVAALLALEQEMQHARGYIGVYHELEVYGICPACQAAAGPEPPVVKLPARFSG
jgi:Fur family ferric uptake transcriptional regulator